jgi:hypothetical protein
MGLIAVSRGAAMVTGFDFHLAAIHLDVDVLLAGFLTLVFVFRKPEQGLLEIRKGLHIPTAHRADEGEEADSVVGVGPVKHREALLTGKARFVE